MNGLADVDGHKICNVHSSVHVVWISHPRICKGVKQAIQLSSLHADILLKTNMDLHDVRMFLEFVLLLYLALEENSNTEGSHY